MEDWLRIAHDRMRAPSGLKGLPSSCRIVGSFGDGRVSREDGEHSALTCAAPSWFLTM